MSTNCTTCGREIQPNPLLSLIAEHFSNIPYACDECETASIVDRQVRRNHEASELRIQQWNDIAPEIYRDSDPAQFPPKILEALNSYDPRLKKGLGLVGESGSCKTRAAYTLLRRHHFTGQKVYSISAQDLSRYAAEQFDYRDISNSALTGASKRVCDHARNMLDMIKYVDVLLLDDLGQGKFTPTAEVALLDLLESRTSRAKPLLWTSNLDGRSLGARLSEEKGQPILRRLIDFCIIVKV